MPTALQLKSSNQTGSHQPLVNENANSNCMDWAEVGVNERESGPANNGRDGNNGRKGMGSTFNY